MRHRYIVYWDDVGREETSWYKTDEKDGSQDDSCCELAEHNTDVEFGSEFCQ